MAEWEYLTWEYLVLTVAFVDRDDGGQVKLINGQELEAWRERNWRLPQALTFYGSQGWELVSAMWRGREAAPFDSLYVLKRPKTPAAEEAG